MKKYMILNKFYTLEYGEYDITLINFEEDKYFSLNGENYRIFKTWLAGKVIDIDSLTSTGSELYNFLKENHIASFEDRFYILESFDIGKKQILYNEKKCPLSRVFIQFESECEENRFGNITSPCWVCCNNNKVTVSDEKRYIRLIEELAANGVQQIILYGGDILGSRSAEALMKAADDSYVQLCIITDENGISEESAMMAAENDATLIVTVDFRNNVDVERFTDLTRRLEKCDVLFKCSVVISSDTLFAYKAAEKELASSGAEIINLSYVMDKSISEEELSEICLLNTIDRSEYKVYSAMNTCMAGALAIDRELNLIPCPEIKNMPLGQFEYKNGSFSFVKADAGYRLADFWLNEKKFLKECSQCSRRNLCMDCRAAECNYQKADADRFTKRECLYMKKCRDSYKKAINAV